jgi:hypothetical protein
MTRSARPILLVTLLAASIIACERDRLTEQSLPTTADAKGGTW